MEKETPYYLGFSAFPGIGPLRFRLLAGYFKSARSAWEASFEELTKVGLGEKLARNFITFKKNFSLLNYVKLLEEKEVKVLTQKDKAYPNLLLEIPDPPIVLYVRGDEEVLKTLCIAVVGTRKITTYGKSVTENIVSELVPAGVTIVSGMAYGVDTVAHESAISHGGKTVAVLGCGVDVIHPKSNTTLYWQIIKKAGCVVSEFPLGHWANKGLFPARNRIISGLSKAVLVTEGAITSGSLITARAALEQGREVYSVPGPVTSFLSAGPHMLIKNGAKVVSEARDILDDLGILATKKMENRIDFFERIYVNCTIEEKKVLDCMKNEDRHFDEILKSTKINPAVLGGILTIMEMKKIIKNLGAGIFSLQTPSENFI